MMAWAPSPADDVPSAAGISALRGLFGLSRDKSSKNATREQTSLQRQSQQQQQQEQSQQQQQQEQSQQQQQQQQQEQQVEAEQKEGDAEQAEIELEPQRSQPSGVSEPSDPSAEVPECATAVAATAAAAAAAAGGLSASVLSQSSGSGEEQTPDQKSVAEACIAWMDTVTKGTEDTPRKTADLYAKDGVLWGTEVCAPDDVLWGTVSEEVRDTPEQIYAYYDYFARLPKLRLVEFSPAPVRVRGDFAAQAGSHMFAWQGADGTTVEMRARFSFTFRRSRPDRPNPWMIVEHYTSSMPTVPAEVPDVSDLLAEERASRKKQVAELQQRAESAECLAAERAVLRVSEHAARTKYNTELEGRVRAAESLAARRAEQIAELERCVVSARSQAGEHARRNAALERRADEAKSRFAKQVAEVQRRAEAAEAALAAERAKKNDDDDDEYAGEIII